MARRSFKYFQDPYAEQTVSVDFDGSTEDMDTGSPLGAAVGIGNIWSLMLTARLTADSTGTDTIMAVGATSGANSIRLDVLSSSGQFKGTIFSSSTVVIKNYSWNNILPTTGKWFQIVLTWDGTTFNGYMKGVLITPTTKTSDNTGTMIDADRSASLGARVDGSSGTAAEIHSAALWVTAMTAAEVGAIWKQGRVGKFDLTRNRGSYISSGGLRHWWRLGLNSSDIGKDYVQLPSNMDMDTNAANITSADIVTSSPTDIN